MPPPEPNVLARVASLTVTCCAVVLLAAVARNFAAAPAAGPTAERHRSPVATGSMIGFFVLLYLVIRLRVGVLPLADPFASALTVLGLALVILGTVINLAGRRELGANWSNQPAIYDAQTLVTTGVFSAVRHPLYGSLVLVGAGASLAFHNGLGLLLTLLVFVPAMHWRASQEEHLLEARFPEYATYKSRTGRLLPRLWGGRS